MVDLAVIYAIGVAVSCYLVLSYLAFAYSMGGSLMIPSLKYIVLALGVAVCWPVVPIVGIYLGTKLGSLFTQFTGSSLREFQSMTGGALDGLDGDETDATGDEGERG